MQEAVRQGMLVRLAVTISDHRPRADGLAASLADLGHAQGLVEHRPRRRLAQRLWQQWRMPGLERLHVVAPDGWRAWRKGDEPPPPGRLRLCVAGPVEDVLASAQDAARLARAAE